MKDKPLIMNDLTISKGRKLERKKIDPKKRWTFGAEYDRFLFQERYKMVKQIMEPPEAFFNAVTFGLRPAKTETEALNRYLAGLYHWYKFVWLDKQKNANLRQEK